MISAEDGTVFEFVSIGPKGHITKIIKFTEMSTRSLYNLGFGDKNEDTGEMDDEIVTDNGDSKRVLATVAATVLIFTEKYPKALIYAEGNTSVRNRLYRIGITKNLSEIQRSFDIYGLLIDVWEKFAPNSDYQAFLVRRKQLKS